MALKDALKMDEMGPHARLYDKIANSPAWLALGYSSRAFYVLLRVKLKQTNNGNIEATLGTMRHAGFKTSSTLAKVIRELETVGLIAKTRQGGIAAGGKLCNLFRFTDKPVHDHPKLGIAAMKATHEWQRWSAIREARAVIREAHKAAKRPKAASS